MRLSSSTSENLSTIVGPSLQRSPSKPDILSVGEIVADTLRCLASGKSMVDIMFNFRIGKSTISKLLLIVVLFKPSTDGWLKIANEFEAKWQMPQCVGALDGKRIAFARSGSVNFNHKVSHSTILMALCDANYNFTCVNIGMPGGCNDVGVFKASKMGKKMLNNTLHFPKASAISKNNINIPYYIVADEAFPFNTYMMRP
ncbi:uncharacterized protein LOC126552331 [Aphis gossypii]|uniref:uncharacterized protein LOC126552331 n=1 Tax=Aphis gossypii TaxID=80765 RepID=UPI002158B9CF|nr:uncharacterized protein LOC126552331 [Aphis gossypii]